MAAARKGGDGEPFSAVLAYMCATLASSKRRAPFEQVLVVKMSDLSCSMLQKGPWGIF